MQQIPHNKEHRKCFVSSPGYTFCISDYSQQESRIMADFARDASMMDLFNNGNGDLHSLVATRVFSTKFKKDFIVSTTENTEYRQLGKTLNFAISYGASAYGIAVSNGITKDEAQELIDLFYNSFPTLKELFQKAKTFGLENGYIITNPLVKTRRWFPEWVEYKKLLNKRNSSKEDYRELNRLKGSIERRSQNSIIQGSAALMTKLALILIRDSLLHNGIRPIKGADVKIILPIHDEIILEVKDGLEDTYSELLKNCMENAGAYICKNVKITAAPLQSKFWKH
jgi:DNA polymerase-1